MENIINHKLITSISTNVSEAYDECLGNLEGMLLKSSFHSRFVALIKAHVTSVMYLIFCKWDSTCDN